MGEEYCSGKGRIWRDEKAKGTRVHYVKFPKNQKRIAL